jgi:tRNA (cmo5U34)-methyltransferase
MAHSVSEHLHIRIADYDRVIRTFIPHYETMRSVQLDLLAGVLPTGGRVLDLGGGTGALAEAIAERFPTVQIEIWDTDPAMLSIARERCHRFGDRVHLIEQSFASRLIPCDAVVACIALHHVKDLTQKGNIYAQIYQALRPGGIFANADATMSMAVPVEKASFRDWTKHMLDQGISTDQIRQHFSDWAKEDYYPPIDRELRLLATAGFAEPDCFWRKAPFAVFGGVKT